MANGSKISHKTSNDQYLELYDSCCQTLHKQCGIPKEQQIRNLLARYYAMAQQSSETVSNFAHRILPVVFCPSYFGNPTCTGETYSWNPHIIRWKSDGSNTCFLHEIEAINRKGTPQSRHPIQGHYCRHRSNKATRSCLFAIWRIVH